MLLHEGIKKEYVYIYSVHKFIYKTVLLLVAVFCFTSYNITITVLVQNKSLSTLRFKFYINRPIKFYITGVKLIIMIDEES
jgi:hypothetical protein